MSREANIQLHLLVIQEAKKLPVGSNKRITIVNRSIQGILRAKSPSYNPLSYQA